MSGKKEAATITNPTRKKVVNVLMVLEALLVRINLVNGSEDHDL